MHGSICLLWTCKWLYQSCVCIKVVQVESRKVWSESVTLPLFKWYTFNYGMSIIIHRQNVEVVLCLMLLVVLMSGCSNETGSYVPM